MPCEQSRSVSMQVESIAREKLGQPVPESNLASDENNGDPQQLH